MVPPQLSTEAFRLFMAIPKSRIDREIEEGAVNYEPARLKVLEFLGTAEEDMTAEQCAEHMHAEMIQACAGRVHPGVHEDVAFHLAGVGARGAARTVLFAAGTTGELGRLNEELDRIRVEAGIEDEEEWEEAEIPPGYQEMQERAGELLMRIENMMVIDILKRYRLVEHAELFEADEAAFDRRVQEGYFVLFPEKRRELTP